MGVFLAWFWGGSKVVLKPQTSKTEPKRLIMDSGGSRYTYNPFKDTEEPYPMLNLPTKSA